MKYSITNSDSFPAVNITLNADEEVKIETGAMVYHTEGITLIGERSGGSVLGSIGRAALGGENYFRTRAHSVAANQQIVISPKGFGRIVKLDVGETQYLLNDGTFLAADMLVDFEMISQRKAGGRILGGTGGMYIMKTKGKGELLVNGFGEIQEIVLDGTAPIIIDNMHVVCWEETVKYEHAAGGGSFGFKTGEGLVNKFSGKGKIYIQTRHLANLASALVPFMPTQKR